MKRDTRVARAAGSWLPVVVVSGAVALWASVASAVEGDVECDLVVALKSSEVLVGSMQFRLGYGSTSGWIAGHGNDPECTSLLGEHWISAFADNESEKALRGGFATIGGIAAPVDVASCVFRGNSAPEAADFELVVDDAADLQTQPIEPLPVLEVTVLDCQPIDSLTTTTTTTTTTSTTLPLCGNWEVVLGIDAAAEPILRLRVSVNHQSAVGDMVRNSGMASCSSLVEGASTVGFQYFDDSPLVLTMTTDEGLHNGDDYVRCLFSGSWANPPVAADFVATVLSSTGAGLSYVPVTITVSATAITAPDACEGRCGDGVAVWPNEECDDANDSDSDPCPGDCQAAECGDGYLLAGVEPCDDGNHLNSDGCVRGCALARCGDDFVHNGVEECDDGNSTDTDVCRNNCFYASCGDGVIHDGLEECDDGGTVDGDGCTSGCRIQRDCGDAIPGGGINASDALRTLQKAVGLGVDCPPVSCDVNDSGSVTVVDALALLRVSVGIETPIHCPAAPA